METKTIIIIVVVVVVILSVSGGAYYLSSSPSASSPPVYPATPQVDPVVIKPPCNLTCKNGGTLDSVNCKCSCPTDYDQPDCANITINSPTFFKDAGNCAKKTGYIWNGYDCVLPSQVCDVKTSDGSQPKCANGENNFWYVKTGGTRDDWSGPNDPRGKTDAMCATARATGTYKVGDPTPWGAAPCLFGWSKDSCNTILASRGCNVPP